MSPEQQERARRYARLGLFALGVVLTLVFVQTTERAVASGRAQVPWRAPLDDDLLIGVGLLVALGVLIAVVVSAIAEARRRGRPTESWWRTDRALFLATTVYGVGVGVFAAWVMEWDGDDEGALAAFLLAALGLISLVANERGRLPVVAILAAAAAATAACLVRLAMGGYRTSYLDDALAFGALFLFLGPFAYLLVRGLLNLVGGGAETSGQVHVGAAVLPLEVAAHEGTYLVTVEAPGLASADEVEARVLGRRLRLLVPRPAAPASEVVFTTRAAGRFPLEVELPQPLQDPPWQVSVADGLLRVQVAPLGD